MQWYFGNGILVATPVAGDLAANPTPMQFGVLQDISVEISGDEKQLFGQNQYPVDTARGKSKVTWKAKTAALSGKFVNDLFFSETISSPANYSSIAEAGAIPTPSGPYTVSVTHSATFATDLGVSFAATGLPLVKVTSAPTTGQYSVAAGVYTFAAADAGLGVVINYTYAAGTGIGQHFVVNNHLMGYSPQFQMVLTNKYQGKTMSLTLFACRANKLTMATKIDDYMIPEFDGSAFANAAGQIMAFDFTD